MRTDLTISNEKIDECALLKARVLTAGMGAAVYFAGAVRGTEKGRGIEAIDYEAFKSMAEHQFGLIFKQVEKRWPVESVRLAHRVGRVEVGEVSIWVEVVAPHRGEAFEACQFIIAEMKRVVPIWKKPIPVL
ncbi:MAG TPA: molybdenum cofactor biosynthesis protein MoaE [Verrucomicrobiae bacterium]|jgi:molybdopterin synthase catalytic subunit|nr:molybdenum cofactor biosynthesis protein MoaE [Verrucomicrobiae bacterium]